ncbi:Hypothetical protein NGAL_HAMBI2605_63910 [Neorhizobium galegae bv. orientalis]|nr:Hypothetical protein NGAL_HAMBI2605_63910 [Neorhizobium galegae bv. orientalis]
MPALDLSKLRITPEILSLIAEIDEFKGAWRASKVDPYDRSRKTLIY